MKELLSIVAGLLFVFGFIPYIKAIWHDRKLPSGTPGKAEPAKASWIIWGILDTITISGMYAEDSLNGQIIGAVIGAWLVVVLAMRYGSSGFTKLDKFCLGGAILSISLWQMFDNPVLGVVTSVGVVFLGSIPTFISAWKDPGRENRLAWTIFWISCVCAVAAIPKWTLADASQPVVFFIIESVMMYILYIHPRTT